MRVHRNVCADRDKESLCGGFRETYQGLGKVSKGKEQSFKVSEVSEVSKFQG
jgi:hypothetical protein